MPHDNFSASSYGARVLTLRRNLKLRRWTAVWLFAFALAVRLLVPAGYMPMAGRAGLEICAEQTPDMRAMASMPGMAMKGMGHGRSMPGDHDHDCGFGAAVGGVAQLPTLILPALLAPVPLQQTFIPQQMERPGLGLAAPPPPKTGPPSYLR